MRFARPTAPKIAALARWSGLALALAALAVVGAFAAQQAGWRPGPSNDWYARRVASPLADALERRFPRAALGDAAGVAGVIVLGGAAESRLAQARALGLAYPQWRIVVSGPGASEYALIARWGEELRSRVIYETRSSAGGATADNARHAFDLLRPAPGERWLLVTSALHMPRAMGAFRRAGFDVAAWPVYDRPRSPEALIHGVHHEMLGLLGYRLSGKTGALFPGASP